MSRTLLSPLDAAWILTESRATPNHVGGLLIFQMPEDAPRDFMRRMMRDFRSYQGFTAPWNRRLQRRLAMLPEWIEDAVTLDLEYHVRHAALPWPGGERELGELVGRLQSTPMDLARPPWECTLIEGLERHRFALFVKMHHSLIDGISGMRLLQQAMSTDRVKSLSLPPFWCAAKGQPASARRQAAEPTMAAVMASAAQSLRSQLRSVPQLVAAFGKILRRVGERGEGMVLPFDAPQSALNGRVREKRRFATQQVAMARLRALASAAGCTLNDVVLALCGASLRRFLLENDNLPAKSLSVGIPVSVRPKGDQGTGNAISFIVATLGTDIEDAHQRLAAIRASVRHAKSHVQSLPREAMVQYTMLLMAPTIVTLLTGMGGRTRPMFNVTVSNVPGPEQPLYFRGARLEAIFPASIVTHGQALNITCQSYAGMMDFGFTGCHTSVPSLQKLAVYLAEALAELEAAILPAPRPHKAGTAGVRARETAKPRRPAPGPRKRQAAATGSR